MTRRDEILFLLRELRAALGWRYLRRFHFRRGGVAIPLTLATAAGYWWFMLPLRYPATTPPPPPSLPSLLDPSTFDPDAQRVEPRRVLDPEGRYLVYREEILDPNTMRYPVRTVLYDRKERRALVRFQGEPAVPGYAGTTWNVSMWLIGSRLVVATGGNDYGWNGRPGSDSTMGITMIDIPDQCVASYHRIEGIFDVWDVDPSGRYAVGLGPVPISGFGDLRDDDKRIFVIDLLTGETSREPIFAERAYFLDATTVVAVTWTAIQGWRWQEDEPASPYRALAPDLDEDRFFPSDGEVEPRARSFHLVDRLWRSGPARANSSYLGLGVLDPDGKWTESRFREVVEFRPPLPVGTGTETNYRGLVVGTWSHPGLDHLVVEPISGLALRNLREDANHAQSVPIMLVDLARSTERVVAWRELDPSDFRSGYEPHVKFLGPWTIGIRDRTPDGYRWRIHSVNDFLYEGPPWVED